MLSRIRHNEIGQEQGLELLNSMERRLDKVDQAGMRARLRSKCSMLEERERKGGNA